MTLPPASAAGCGRSRHLGAGQIDHSRRAACDERLRVLSYMAMMGEQHHLRRLAKLGQQAECRCAAIVIEMHEKIIGDEGQRLGGRAILLDARNPEGKKEL